MRAVTAFLALSLAACTGGGGDDAVVDPVPWHELTKPPGSVAIGAVYANGDRVYVYGNDTSTYETTDNGDTWTQHPFSMVASSNDGQTMYAVGGGGHQRSRDGGATWVDRNTTLDVYAISVDPNLLYGFTARFDQDQSVWFYDPYRSDNDGAATVPLNLGLAYPVNFMTDAEVTERVYADTQQGADTPRYNRSDDRGATWTEISFDLGKIRVDPAVGGSLWRFKGAAVQHSDDAGDTWTDLPDAPGTVQELVAETDGTALVITADHTISQVTTSGEYAEVGSVPVDVGTALRGGTTESLVVVPPGDLPDTIYVTHTLGN